MVLHASTPQTGFFQPLSRRLAQLCSRVFRVYLKTMFNNTFQRTLPPCRSLTFLLNVGIESLNTSVRVWKPWSQRSPFGVNLQGMFRGATGVPEERWPTKTSSGTRENVPAKLNV